MKEEGRAKSVYLTESQIEYVEKIAEINGISFSAVLKQAINNLREYLEAGTDEE